MAIDPNDLSATATLTFSEDFNSFNLWNGATGLDTRPGWAMWPQFDAGFTLTGNGEQGWYVQPSYAPTAAANPFSVSNGVLTISANPTPSNLLQYTNNLPYTTGWIDTYHEFSQTYGYFEMRAQLPAGQGTWPCFWLLPEDGSWPPEIDALESINGNNVLATTVHSTVSGANKVSNNHYSTGSGISEPGMTTGFHTYGVDWEADNITFYFDGKEVFQTPTPADLQGKPMYMIASLAIGGYWPGNPTSSESWPQQMQIDYLRAYSAAPAAVSPPPPVISPPPPVIVSPPPASSGGNVSPPPPPPPTTLTANYDVVWRNGADGTIDTWGMNGAQVVSAQEDTFQGAVAAPNASWSVAGIGEFAGGGTTDILWRNVNGNLIDWIMNGSQITSGQAVTFQGNPATPDASWSVAGIGDFNGDGTSDLLWRNADGTVGEWTMNGSQITSAQAVTFQGNPVDLSPSWSLAGVGDFTGNGTSDLLWRNADGTVGEWTMNGSQITSAQAVTFQGNPVDLSPSWSLAGVGDFTGNGTSDLLWRNTDGTLGEWTMNGSQITSAQAVTFQGNPAMPDASWQIAQIGDFSGTGTSDILWRNTDGALAEWTMNGSQITSGQSVTFQGNPVSLANSFSTLAKPTDFIG